MFMKSKLILAAICLLLGGNVDAFAAKPSALSQVKAAVAMKTLAESQNYTVSVSQALSHGRLRSSRPQYGQD